jgi:hypothetical protein
VSTGEYDDNYPYREVAGLVFIFPDMARMPFVDEWENVSTLVSEDILNMDMTALDIRILDVIDAIQDPESLLNPAWNLGLNHVTSSGCITSAEILLTTDLCNVTLT